MYKDYPAFIEACMERVDNYNRNIALMDKRLMELVEWNEGKPAAEPAGDSELAKDQAVPSEFAGEENVLLASG